MTSPSAPPQLDLRTQPGKPPLLFAQPTPDLPNPTSWAQHHRDTLRGLVAEHGGVLVRGLGLRDPGQVAAVFTELSGGLMADRESFATRRPFPGGVYSSTKWPANQPMCMHHELSYALEFPGLMLFACLQAAPTGGATGISDAQKILTALPTELVARFEREGWLLVRNYNDDIGSPLSEAFGTDDRPTIETYCRANGIDYQWQPDGGLRTRQRRHAIIAHPITGQDCWFNQIAFLNEWTLDPEVREFLVDVYGPESLPFNTYYGNGEPLTPDTVAMINQTYETHTIREPWRNGDLMIVDNIRAAHSREAYAGQREVLVGMASPLRMDGWPLEETR
ncbi:TauD/TfdA family dioxygenase [Pseudonocardia eucalypti]|uniref:TauD/TfdA family dioxygenase n=1 Tax=Pseudonocardia eucalypti TaxID=648755 RepID=A0ABP9PIV0_9PSEU|nr:alpha-ketoglutarate-dependent taurine dioxygenase [Pseudonocardia eucalypti]